MRQLQKKKKKKRLEGHHDLNIRFSASLEVDMMIITRYKDLSCITSIQTNNIPMNDKKFFRDLFFKISLFLVGNQPKSRATHSYQCVQHFPASIQWLCSFISGQTSKSSQSDLFLYSFQNLLSTLSHIVCLFLFVCLFVLFLTLLF